MNEPSPIGNGSSLGLPSKVDQWGLALAIGLDEALCVGVLSYLCRSVMRGVGRRTRETAVPRELSDGDIAEAFRHEMIANQLELPVRRLVR